MQRESYSQKMHARVNCLKFLIFTNHYPVEGIKSSGSDMLPIENIKRWLMKGHRVCIITSKAGLWLYRYKGIIGDSKVSFHVIITLGAKRIGLLLEYIIRTIITSLYSFRINPNNFDVVISCSEWGIFDALPAVLLKMRSPRIIWVSFVWHLISPPTERVGKTTILNVLPFISQRLVLMLISKWSDLIFTETKVIKNLLKERRIRDDKVKIARGAFDSDYLSKTPEQRKIYDACFLGRIYPEKGIFDLVKIWKLVCRKKVDAKLVIIGSGPRIWENKLKSEIENQKVDDNIIFLGPLSEEEKYKTLKASKIFIFPSFEEGLPIAVCEAMACSLPVIAYELPTYKDGWMSLDFVRIKIRDIEKFSDAIIKLLFDDILRNKYINATKEIILKYDFDNLADTILSEIERACLRS